MAEIGIDPSLEHGQFKSSDGALKCGYIRGRTHGCSDGLGTQEWKITESSSIRAERDWECTRG